MFPSPSRGSYFSIKTLLIIIVRILVSFRPLPGDLISQLTTAFDEYKAQYMVSVPFPGILFLNVKADKVENDQVEIVSVPFPGILFLNNFINQSKTN